MGYAIRHKYGVDGVRTIARALDEAGVDAIEVAHGDGLSGSSFNYGFGAHTDWEWIEAAADVVKNARLTTLLLPGIGTVEELEAGCLQAWHPVCAHRHPLVHRSRYRPSSISGAARDLGMDVAGFLMMSHMIDPEALASQAQDNRMESYGAHCVYVTDSAGALDMDGYRVRLEAYDRVLKPETQRGVHAHHNLSLGVANSIVAVQTGAVRAGRQPDGHGRGRAPRRQPLEFSSRRSTARAGSMAATCSP